MADISKITLPSGTTYDIKDAVARQMISGGISFVIAWDGLAEPNISEIPTGVTIIYNDQLYAGALTPSQATVGYIFLVKAQNVNATTPDDKPLDYFIEYVTVGDTTATGGYIWEQLGTTDIEIPSYSLDRQTVNVIGENSTFTITQPTIALATDTSSGTGKVQVVSGITSASASGDSVSAVTGYSSTTSDTFLKSVKVTSQPTVSLTANTATATGRITYVESQGSATTTKLSASASGGAVSASGDNVTAITALGTPSTDSAIKSITPTTNKLVTTTVTGVSGSTTASKVTAGTSQTTISGFTASTTSNYDSSTDILKGATVSNETLILGAYKPNTQTTTQFTASNVTVPVAATSATTVATGNITSTGTGSSVVTNVAAGSTFNAVTGYSSPTTDTVIGTASTFNVTNPTVTLSSGTSGDVTVATGVGAATTKYLSAAASGTAVGANGTATAITGLGTPTTKTVLGTGSTITVTPTTTYLKATASGANTAWNNKDMQKVLDQWTDLVVQ